MCISPKKPLHFNFVHLISLLFGDFVTPLAEKALAFCMAIKTDYPILVMSLCEP